MPRHIDGSGIYHHMCEETRQGANLEFGDFSKENFEKSAEDNLDGLMEPDHRSHPELTSDFTGVLIGVYIPRNVDSVETERLYHNAITNDSAASSDITHTPGVCDDSKSPNSFFAPFNPTPETHIN